MLSFFGCCCTEESNHDIIEGGGKGNRAAATTDVFTETKEEFVGAAHPAQLFEQTKDALWKEIEEEPALVRFGDDEDDDDGGIMLAPPPPDDVGNMVLPLDLSGLDAQPEPEAGHEDEPERPPQPSLRTQQQRGREPRNRTRAPTSEEGQMTFTATLDTPGKIGLNVRHHNATMLEILTIKDGQIKVYNEKVAAGLLDGIQVEERDVINKVNGQTGSATMLLKTIAESGKQRAGHPFRLELSFIRSVDSRASDWVPPSPRSENDENEQDQLDDDSDAKDG